MDRFDIDQAPPARGEIDARRARAGDELSRYRRSVLLIAAAELSALTLAYWGGLSLSETIESLPAALAIAGVGPSAAVVAITTLASLRYRELARRVRALQPADDPAAPTALRGLAAGVDRYLARLDDAGREITRAEVAMLEGFLRRTGRRAAAP